MSETTTTEELLDALRAAGVDLDSIEVPEDAFDVAGMLMTAVEPFMARRDDGEDLCFSPSESLEGEEPEGWTWAVWDAHADSSFVIQDGWEPDLAHMVRVVVSFLKAGAPDR